MTKLPKLDETHLKVFPNVYEFAKDVEGINFYPRQLSLMLQMHGDVCLYCSDKQFLDDMYDETNDVIEENLTFLAHGVCPKCGKTKLDHLKDRRWLSPNALLLNAGQRSGKIATIAALSLYAEYQMLNIIEDDGTRYSPVDLFKLEPDTVLRNSLIGSSYEESIYMYEFVRWLRKSSKWFIDYFKLLDQAGLSNGCSYYEETDYSIKYIHRDIVTLCEHAQTRHSVRGFTRYFVGLGDVAWLDSNTNLNDTDEPLEIWKAAKNSLRTLSDLADIAISVNVNLINPMLVCGTTSRSKKDFNADVVEYSLFDMRSLTRKYATWEFRPDCRFGDFKIEFNKNFPSANRDLACYKLQHTEPVETKG